MLRSQEGRTRKERDITAQHSTVAVTKAQQRGITKLGYFLSRNDLLRLKSIVLHKLTVLVSTFRAEGPLIKEAYAFC